MLSRCATDAAPGAGVGCVAELARRVHVEEVGLQDPVRGHHDAAAGQPVAIVGSRAGPALDQGSSTTFTSDDATCVPSRSRR
jgi:hypothetical protein